jgi:hypothetical protein
MIPHMGTSRSVRIVDSESGLAEGLALALVRQLAVRRNLVAARLRDKLEPSEQINERHRRELVGADVIILIVSHEWDPAALDSISDILKTPLLAGTPLVIVYLEHVSADEYQQYFAQRWQIEANDLARNHPNLCIFDHSAVGEDELTRVAGELAKHVFVQLDRRRPRDRTRRGVLALLAFAGAAALTFAFASSQPQPTAVDLGDPKRDLTVLADAEGLSLCDGLTHIAELELRCLQVPSFMLEHAGTTVAWARSTPMLRARGDKLEFVVGPTFWSHFDPPPTNEQRLGPFRVVDRQAFIVLVGLIVEISRGHAPTLDDESWKQLLADVELLMLSAYLVTANGGEPRGRRLPSGHRERFHKRCQDNPDTPAHLIWLCPALVSQPPDPMLRHCRDQQKTLDNLTPMINTLLLNFPDDPSCEQLLGQAPIACVITKSFVLGPDKVGASERFIRTADKLLRNSIEAPQTLTCPKHVPGFADMLALELASAAPNAPDQSVTLLNEAARWACVAARSLSQQRGDSDSDGILQNWAELALLPPEFPTPAGWAAEMCSRESLLQSLDALAPPVQEGVPTNADQLAAALLAWMHGPTQARAWRLQAIYERLPDDAVIEIFNSSDMVWVTTRVHARCCDMSSPCVCEELIGDKTPEKSRALEAALQSWSATIHHQ